MSKRSFSYGKQPALTLIEVLTALAILSTLLVGILVAFRRNAEQIQAEAKARRALTRVDHLLWEWARQGVYAPRDADGTLSEKEQLRWHTHVVSRAYRTTLGLDIVRLQVEPSTRRSRSHPLVTIDLPVPAGDEPPGASSGP